MAEEKIEEKNFELEERKWYHRRKIAYRCFWSNVVIVLFVLLAPLAGYDVENIVKFSDIIVWYIAGSFGIIGAFFGFATWFDMKRK